MIPACLKNFIGVRYQCSEDAPKSGLFINDLEGATLNLAAKIVSGEDKTGIGLMRKKIEFGTALVLEDLRDMVLPYYSMNTAIDLVRSADFSSRLYPTEAVEKGLRIRLPRRGMKKIQVVTAKVRLKDKVPGLKLKVLELGVEKLFDLVWTPFAGGWEATVQLDYLAETEELFLLIDTTAAEPFGGEFRNIKSSCGCSYVQRTSKTHIEIRGWDGYTARSAVYGITAEVSVVCDVDALYCALAQPAKFLILYRSGIELVKEWLASERFNEFTTLRREEADALLARWQEEYSRRYAVFANSIRPILASFPDKDCIACRGSQFFYSS